MVLEEGMTLREASFSPQEAEFLEGRMLTMEQAARMFHIPPPLVGILRYATYSNITEQHKMLYQDVLAPWCVMLQEEMELQLLPEFGDVENVYLEYNLEGKLAGSFEEQSRALSTAVGGPYMTRNEARGRMNLPQKDGGDDLITPLNVTRGGQASPQDSGSQNRAESLERFFARQGQVLKSNGGRFDAGRWSRELAEDLAAVGVTE
jgi:phage portal protein BeeE